jgi:predicted transcriptional regulator
MSNAAERLIKSYNEFSDYLENKKLKVRDEAFSQAIDKLANKDSLVRKNNLFLKRCATLRNMIVHHQSYPKEIIAMPEEKCVKDFERMVGWIVQPKKLHQVFAGEVKVFDSKVSLPETLAFMKNNDYSQVVSKNEDGRLCVLTSEGITNWLRGNVEEDVISIRDTSLSEVTKCEPEETHKFLSQNSDVNQLQEIFRKGNGKGMAPLFAAVITNDGTNKSQPVGIATPWDVMALEESFQ